MPGLIPIRRWGILVAALVALASAVACSPVSFPTPPPAITAVSVSTGTFGTCDMFHRYAIDLVARTVTTTDQCAGSTPAVASVTQAQVDGLRVALDAAGVRSWAARYADPLVQDGASYSVSITDAAGGEKGTYIYMRYPPGWTTFTAGLAALGITI